MCLGRLLSKMLFKIPDGAITRSGRAKASSMRRLRSCIFSNNPRKPLWFVTVAIVESLAQNHVLIELGGNNLCTRWKKRDLFIKQAWHCQAVVSPLQRSPLLFNSCRVGQRNQKSVRVKTRGILACLTLRRIPTPRE